MGVFKVEEEEGEEEEEPEEVSARFGIALTCEDPIRVVTSGSTTDYEMTLENLGDSEDTVQIKLDLVYSEEEEEEHSEWTVKIEGLFDEVWDVTLTEETEREIEMSPHEKKVFVLHVIAPRGPKYGDRLNVVAIASSRGDPALSDTRTISTTVRQSIMAVKTSIGHEKSVADSIASRAKSPKSGIYSVLSPTTLRGYVLVETINPDRLEEIVKGIRRARGIVKGETSLTEIDHFLAPKPLVSGIVEGDIVELVAGPFKGEKARVQQIDEGKEEITVELFEAVVPIPVTVRGDSVRVIQKEEREE
ncbi:MAG: transcription elongation factor Spt5 [Thermoplasmata archaeon]